MSDRHESTCYFCDETAVAAIEEHHLVPQRLNGSDEPENTVNLCGTHHNLIEELYDDDFYERLGIAVEEVKQDEYVETSAGVAVDARHTEDRELPAASPHVSFEEWHERLTVTEIEECDVSDRLKPFIESHGDTILKEYKEQEADKKPLENYFEEIPEWVLDGGDEPTSFTYTHGEQAKYPVLTIKNPYKNRYDQQARAEDPNAMGKIDREKMEIECVSQRRKREGVVKQKELPDFYRIHCGYCHTAFAQYEHADAARHLRIRHGIENPYENTDSTYRDPDRKNPLSGFASDLYD